MSSYSHALTNPILFTNPFGLDASSANENVPVRQGDVILFGKGVTATQSVDEATVTGKRHDNSAGMTLIFPGSFSPTLRPGPTPVTLPRILPLAIPIAYNTLDAYLKGPSVVEDIAEFLEKIGVPSEVLRGPEIRNTDSDKTADELLPGSLKRSPSYDPRYGDKTRSELDKLAKRGDSRAGKMKKLVDQVDRLLQKNKGKK
ncbi:hypothetical protein [Dyadobacter bucti]|uniref:hypothetical protein n=1 Tax=Dyadobacter bucti TaxID=2572203 RepID=UPI003F721603